ncbi:MAG: TonB-dependent receptor, partial [Panacibacter sp.]
INTAMVERIEILKGAQSTLWGSDAVAGVINIITKKAGKNKINPSASISYGSYETVKANAGLDGSLDKLFYNLQYGYTNSKGFSSAYDSTGIKNFDDDKFERNSIQASVGYHFTPMFTAKINSLYGKYTTGLDAGAFKDDKDYTNTNSNFINGITLTQKGSNYAVNFINTYTRAKRQLHDDSTSVGGFAKYSEGEYNGYTFVSDLYGNIQLAKKLSLLAGAQRKSDKTDQSYLSISSYGPFATALGDSAKTVNYAAYASLSLLDWNHFNAEAGVRYNNHSIYGSNTTFSFNPSYNIDEDTRVFLNISSAYRVPSLYQLYSDYGNKDLQPEKSKNYEIGVQTFSNNKKNSLRLVAFKRDIKDVIAFYSDPVTYASQYINRDEQHDFGFEVENNFALGKIGQWVNNFSYVDGEGKNANVKMKNLYRRPNFTLNSSLSVQPVKNLVLMPSFRFVGSRPRGVYDAGPAVMPQYYTLNLYAAYTFAKQYRLFADFNNITNQQYFDIPGYNTRGSNFTVGLSAQW